jgi:hypothetical protein
MKKTKKVSCLPGIILLQAVLWSACSKIIMTPHSPHSGGIVVTTTRYYIDNNGSDSSDGLSPNTAWKTLGKINSAPKS